MKVLIVEDRQELADNVAQYLSSQDYLCEQATSRRDALMMARTRVQSSGQMCLTA